MGDLLEFLRDFGLVLAVVALGPILAPWINRKRKSRKANKEKSNE